MVMATLRLNGDVHQFFVLLEESAIGFAALWLMRNDRDDGCELAAADLPDVEIRNDGVAIALDSAPNLDRQIGSLWSHIQQNSSRIA
jgi:hypothetical protein